MAIARDTSGSGSEATGTGLTYAYTNAGDIILVSVLIAGRTTDDVASVTYGGDALTKITEIGYATLDNFMSVYYRIAPKTGANNIVITLNNGANKRSCVVSYTGAKQSAQPDASGTGVQASSDTFTDSVTTVADNSWVAFFTSNDQGANSNGTNYVQLANTGGFNVGDSDAAVTPAGSFSQTATKAGANWMGIQVSVSPAAVVSTVRNLAALGVG